MYSIELKLRLQVGLSWDKILLSDLNQNLDPVTQSI